MSEVIELPSYATWARRVARAVKRCVVKAQRLEVKANQLRRNVLRTFGEKAQRKARLNRRHHSCHRPKNARGLASGDLAWRGKLGQQAAKARRRARIAPTHAATEISAATAIMRQQRRRHSRESNRAAIDQRQAQINGAVVQQRAGLEVVEAIDDEVAGLCVAARIGWAQVIDKRPDHYRCVDRSDPRLRRLSLGHGAAGILLGEERLPLQIRALDQIPIDHDDGPNPRARELLADDRSERTASDHQHACRREALLASRSKPRQLHLPLVAGVGETHGSERSPTTRARAG